MTSLARIQNAIDKAEIPLELVRGEGYQYFVFNNGINFDSETIYICYLNQLSVKEWVDEAKYSYAVISERLIPKA